MQHGAMSSQVTEVIKKLEGNDFKTHLSEGIERTIIGVIGDKAKVPSLALEAMPGVEKVVTIVQPFKLVSRQFRPSDTVININGLKIGGNNLQVIAGPCAVESREQLLEAASIVKDKGATILRGGAFKPRTSPYAFQGLDEEGLKILAEARDKTGMPIATEVVDPRHVDLVSEYADILQIGARNMQNFLLLKEIGKTKKPVILKRGSSATIEEWLMAAEYILSEGNYSVILCERGIRTFETFTRNTLDLSAVPIVKHLSHLPIIVDPSHGTGKNYLVAPMAKAAIAAGADGLMIEVHPRPSEAMCDGPQSLDETAFGALMASIKPWQ